MALRLMCWACLGGPPTPESSIRGRCKRARPTGRCSAFSSTRRLGVSSPPARLTRAHRRRSEGRPARTRADEQDLAGQPCSRGVATRVRQVQESRLGIIAPHIQPLQFVGLRLRSGRLDGRVIRDFQPSTQWAFPRTEKQTHRCRTCAPTLEWRRSCRGHSGKS